MLSIQHAEAVWLLYSSFPQAYRRTFPLSVLHQTFRQVVPRYSDIKILIGNPRTRNPSVVREHRRKVRKLAAEWEMRLRVVAGDILAPRRNSARQEGEKKKEVLHTPGVLTGGLRKLSILGDKTGCESILLELKSRFPPSLSSSSSDAASSSLPTVSPSEWRTLYDYSLRSVVRWLSLNIYRAPTAQGEILSAISSLKRLISGMQSQGVPAGEQTALVLLDAGRYTSSPAAVQVQKVREGFEDLTRVILEGGGGRQRTGVESWKNTGTWYSPTMKRKRTRLVSSSSRLLKLGLNSVLGREKKAVYRTICRLIQRVKTRTRTGTIGKKREWTRIRSCVVLYSQMS